MQYNILVYLVYYLVYLKVHFYQLGLFSLGQVVLKLYINKYTTSILTFDILCKVLKTYLYLKYCIFVWIGI